MNQQVVARPLADDPEVVDVRVRRTALIGHAFGQEGHARSLVAHAGHCSDAGDTLRTHHLAGMRTTVRIHSLVTGNNELT